MEPHCCTRATVLDLLRPLRAYFCCDEPITHRIVYSKWIMKILAYESGEALNTIVKKSNSFPILVMCNWANFVAS